MKRLSTVSAILAMTASLFMASADSIPLNLEATLTAGAGSGTFAPYYIASNSHGLHTQPYEALLRLHAGMDTDFSKKFSFGFGVDVVTGYSSKVDYLRYSASANNFVTNPQSPAPFILQQLFAEVKYRSLFATVGLKERESYLLDYRLSSGDLVYSGNSRPISEARAGFNRFVDVPFTNGWLQIHGVLAYGISTESQWVRDHYNYYNDNFTTGWYYNYKHLYFRSNPDKPLCVTFGMQGAGQFGGKTFYYIRDKFESSVRNPAGIKEFAKMILPGGGEGYYYGNHVGSWDFKALYRLKSGATISGYFEFPWEDGSGIGKLNGFDGLYGIEYHSNKPAIVSGAVIEYLDFTNQSGPIHFDPDDSPGANLPDHTDGADDYYNNLQYNGYALFGMSIGTPMLRSPLYNLDGQMAYVCNRMRGVHMGVEGNISPTVTYRLLASYRKGWGTPKKPIRGGMSDTSVLVEASMPLPWLEGLSASVSAAFDAGSMYGHNYGALLTVKYNFNKIKVHVK